MASRISNNEERWSTGGLALNVVNRSAQRHLEKELKPHFDNLPRITNISDPFFGCLSDSQGQPLRYTPDNDATPPGGQGVQLTYRALPHYETRVAQRLLQHEKQCQFCDPKHCTTCKALRGKSQPIPVQNEHEFAHLYLQEFYKKQPCGIPSLDASAILLVLSRSDCFPTSVRKQADKVREEVRNKWAHANTSEWTPDRLNSAFHELETLANMLPNNTAVIQELGDRKKDKPSREDYERELAGLYLAYKKLPDLHKINSVGISGEVLLADKVSSMKISQKRLDEANIAINNSKVTEWGEKSDINFSYGISKEDMESFGETFVEGLGCSEQKDKLQKFFKRVKFTENTDIMMEDFALRGTSVNSEHVVVRAHKQKDGKMTVAHTSHTLRFDRETFDKFTVDQVEAIEGHFSKNKMLEKLRQNGVINTIAYES